ncbi:hypothetical protein [Pseudomonas sp. T1.Ur]|uniref:hypothetical protein n=1 Tax=Pseudomonas sp. T1.Ur TaxID=2928704 RepID=UPI00201E58DD|nr:hypothetical protein [Pseudomonas sp. T1.Ur]MCL6701496.1 hypothetical protein [Pseudomonas sp. T1.Ur]
MQDTAIRFNINWRVLCASPDYLARYGESQTPADLDQTKLIVLVTFAGPLNTFYFVVDGQERNHTVPMSQAWETKDGALERA